MLTILVNSTPLFIPADTSLSLEATAAWADIDNITSDIIWTFDIPAEPNAQVFAGAHHIVVSQHAGYDCEIRYQGIPIATGTLYIQQTDDERTYSCGITFNHLGIGWGKRKLAENEYNQDITISLPTDTLDTHRDNFRAFLKDSLDPDSWYKFFLAYAPEFYKNNDEYGYYAGELSHLQNSLAQDLAAKFINRLFVDNEGNLIEQPDTVPDSDPEQPLYQGLRIFNHNSSGYAFVPAIRLAWLLNQLFASAGATLCGSFATDDRIKQLFMQSFNALDGDLSQLNIYEHLYINSGVEGIATPPINDGLTLDIGVRDLSYPAFRITGSTAPVVNWSFIYDTDTLSHITIPTTYASPFRYREEVLLLLFRSTEKVAANAYPQARSVINSLATQNRDFVYGDIPSVMRFNPTGTCRFVTKDNNMCDWFDGVSSVYTDVQFLNLYSDIYAIQLTTTRGDTVPTQPTQDADIIGALIADAMLRLDTSKQWVVELCKFSVDTVEHGTWDNQWSSVNNSIIIPGSTTGQCAIQIQKYGQFEKLTYIETIQRTNLSSTNSVTNIFSIALQLAQHLPDTTNAEFIKTLCQTFGLNFYVGGADRTVQLSFFSDVFKAGGIAVDGFVTGSRRLTYSPTRYEVKLPSLLQQRDINPSFLLPDILTYLQLQAARTNKRKSVFVTVENAYRLSTLDSESNLYSWLTNAGNNRPLVVNEQGETKQTLSPAANIPNMHVCDSQRTPKYLLHLNGSGNSPLFDDDYTGSFDLCLVQYRGRQSITLQQEQDNDAVVTEAFIEAANPTRFNADGTEDPSLLHLTTTGSGSIGEECMKPYYQFLADREEFEFSLRVPADMFLQLYSLLQPQRTPAAQQSRWLYYRSQRYLPSKMSFQFSPSGLILATVTCSRPL